MVVEASAVQWIVSRWRIEESCRNSVQILCRNRLKFVQNRSKLGPGGIQNPPTLGLGGVRGSSWRGLGAILAPGRPQERKRSRTVICGALLGAPFGRPKPFKNRSGSDPKSYQFCDRFGDRFLKDFGSIFGAKIDQKSIKNRSRIVFKK